MAGEIGEWDPVDKVLKQRDATPDELLEIASRIIPKVPRLVKKWAAIEALIEANKDSIPDAYFQTLPNGERKKAKNRWEKRDTLSINSSLLSGAVTAQLITQNEANNLMIRAEQIEMGL